MSLSIKPAESGNAVMKNDEVWPYSFYKK